MFRQKWQAVGLQPDEDAFLRNAGGWNLCFFLPRDAFLTECKKSGMSQAAFCLKFDLCDAIDFMQD